MVSYLEVLRESPGFRLLFSARVASLLGDWFSLIAVIAMFREVEGSSPTALSGLLILKLLPIFFAGPVAGVVADRFSRRGIMVISDLIRIVLVLGLLAAPATPRPIEFAYVLILLQVLASAFFEPARSAILPQLVPDRHLSAANALGAMMWSIVFSLGAAAGGLVTGWLGWRTALIIDAATYLASAMLIARIVAPPRVARPRSHPDWPTLSGLRDLRDGLAFILRRRDVATVLLIKSGWGIAGSITLFLTLFGERDYAVGGRPDLGVSLLYFARGAGTGIGPLLARRVVDDESGDGLRWLITISFVWTATFYMLFSFVREVWLAASLVMIAHFGGSVLWVYSSVTLQRIVPDEYRGRVMSTDLGLATLSISASTWIYGLLAAQSEADLRSLVRLLCFTLVVPTALWWFAAKRWPARRAADSSY